ncbi:MAG: response regulator, partial [Symploca sp. SIO2G7]|nr:response regulator [Symploca sp. SIO2G7]
CLPLRNTPAVVASTVTSNSSAILNHSSLATSHHNKYSNGLPPSSKDKIGDLEKSSNLVAKSKYLIVCIDDSQAMLEQIESYLASDYFTLKLIVDPISSVADICAMRPDLVLMDVSMPNINGNSLCKILKRSFIFKDVPIIMISSNISAVNKAQAQAAGATNYLGKPFSKSQLMAVIEPYLEIPLNKSG